MGKRQAGDTGSDIVAGNLPIHPCQRRGGWLESHQ